MKVRYEEMFPDELKSTLDNNPLAYLPLGVMEFHGWHNALGLDSLKAQRICELAAEKTGGVVLPTLNIGHDLFPELDAADAAKRPNKAYDCYAIEPETYHRVLEQYFENIFKLGFKKLLVLAGHYPNKDIGQLAAKKFKNSENQIWVMTEADLVGERGDHAGTWETSLMMAMFPSLVDIDRGKAQDNRLLAVWGDDPVSSSLEYGQKMLKQIIDKIVHLVS